MKKMICDIEKYFNELDKERELIYLLNEYQIEDVLGRQEYLCFLDELLKIATKR